MSIHGSRVFAQWVVATLRAGGLIVGEAMKPAGVPANAGYAIVYPIAGGRTDGTLDDPNEMAEPRIQVTSYGVARYDDDTNGMQQCQWVVDRVRALLNVALPVTLTDGRKVIQVSYPFADVSVIREDDTAGPPLFYAPDVIEFRTVPG